MMRAASAARAMAAYVTPATSQLRQRGDAMIHARARYPRQS